MNPRLDYDRVIYLACPGYGASIEKISSLISPKTKRITSLGIGTGNLELRLLKKYKKLKIMGYDSNKDYIRKAKMKLGKRLNAVVKDITKLVLPNSKVVISSLTFHHLSDKNKKKLFKKIYTSLNLNGQFINYDIVKAESREEHKKFVNYLIKFMRKNRLSKGFISEERQILNGVGKYADRPMTLMEQRDILRKLGFKFEILWKRKLFVIYKCTKRCK